MSEFKYESITAVDLKAIYEDARFKGFNRDILAKKFIEKFGMKACQEIAFITALRGPVKAMDLKIKFARNKTPRQMGMTHSARNEDASPSRICACFADFAAFALKKLNIPKRINIDCPAWLQFPSAGGIDLPARLREQHRMFAEEFSGLIGGAFDETIYSTQVANAYLDESLRLFD